MNEPKFTFVEPGRDRRKRKEHLKAVMKHQPGTARAVELANLARDFHENRELNMAMDTARQCLLESEGTVSFLVNAYICHARDDIHRMFSREQVANLPPLVNSAGSCHAMRPVEKDEPARQLQLLNRGQRKEHIIHGLLN